LNDGDFDVLRDRRDRAAEEEGRTPEDVVESQRPIFFNEAAVEIGE